MKRKLAILGLLAFSVQAQANNEVLTGIEGLACAAILCLSTGSPPGECSPSLNHYFNIDFDDFGKTIKERVNFLSLCPAANMDSNMTALVSAIARGAGRCDAKSLNATLIGYPRGYQNGGCIDNKKPAYCTAYENHEYTRLGQTVYVVDPPKTTFWPFQNQNIGAGSFGNGAFGSTTTQSCGRWVTTPPAP